MKKLFAILGMLTCMIGLCACGQDEAEMTAEQQNLLESGEKTVEAIDRVVAEGVVEQYETLLAQYPGLTPEQYGLPSEDYAAYTGWRDALKDIGVFEGTNGGKVVIDEEEAVVKIQVNVLGSDHNATVEMIRDLFTGDYQSITTNVSYSLGEIMTKALMNTVIGMGTVFSVLILISLIISCFTIISRVEAKKQKTETAAAGSSVQADPVVTQIAQKEELSDDTELVAVIAAAIAAYEGSGSTDGFVVRSIRKANKSKWQNA